MQHRYGQDNVWDLNIKLEIPEYDGTMKGDEFSDWKVFAHKDLTNHKTVKLGKSLNTWEKADLWWEHLQ